MEIVCCHTRDCCDKPGYKRTIYCVEVAPQLFDVIFNSQSGYRGAYFQSPERGLSANGLVLSTVTPRLVAWTRDRCIHQGPAFAEKSLSAASANYGSRKSHFHSVIGARANGPLQCEQMSRSLMGDGSAIFTHSRNGVARRHGARKVRFIGGFLNDAHDEYVAPHKKSRATDIWARGLCLLEFADNSWAHKMAFAGSC